MKFILRILSLAAILSLLSFSSINAQTVYFCEGVDDDGYAIGSSSSFTISRSGGYLYVLTRLGYSCETSHVYLDFYKINSRGKEVFEETLEMDTEPSWSWFWKEVTFYESGTYVVYIADEYGYPLADGEVRISFK
jgi:hypothetical protein